MLQHCVSSAQSNRMMSRNLSIVGISLAAVVGLVMAGYVLAFNDRMLPNVSIGTLPLGGLTKDQALDRVQERLSQLRERGILLDIEGKQESIRPEAIGLSMSPEELLEIAWRRGREHSVSDRLGAWITSPLLSYEAPASMAIDQARLTQELELLSEIIDNPRKDVRLQIEGTSVGALYDVRPGRILDIEAAAGQVAEAVTRFNLSPVILAMVDDIPHASPDSAPNAIRQAEYMMRDPLVLIVDERTQITVDRATIGSWIASGYEEDRLVATPNLDEISRYVTQIAERTDIIPRKPNVEVVEGRVTSFVPPTTGRSLEQDKTIALLVDALEARRRNEPGFRDIELPIREIRPPSEKIGEGHEGIVELIGAATTPFTGSPKNRIGNIKNGVRFLSGILVAPGQEFSTLRALGAIDNSRGYLPELVIKGDRTVKEYGGGLCQTSTTLFRAALDAGLPITARRNHSFRISYYEKDGTGADIGPGLDATIYDPALDFKFRNDTPGSILIFGYVIGDRVTFELYGMKDGRRANLKGPVVLSTVPAGDPIYMETDTLLKGTVKQVEIPHPGATTTATYTVTYPDGRVATQEFKSYYRRWPARYLVGTRE